MKKKKTLSPSLSQQPAPVAAASPSPVSAPVKSPKAASPKVAAPKRVVSIDYPLEGEIVRSGAYTVRAATPTSERVEISIDGKEWQSCRECVGYWWYDWSGYNAGPHSVRVRIPGAAPKRYVTSKPRQFTVLI